jgi:hypothetical protein
MRTLLRPGRYGVLVKEEGARGTRFLVRGPEAKDRSVFVDLEIALRSFERVERGLPPTPPTAAPKGDPRGVRQAALSTAA